MGLYFTQIPQLARRDRANTGHYPPVFEGRLTPNSKLLDGHFIESVQYTIRTNLIVTFFTT